MSFVQDGSARTFTRSLSYQERAKHAIAGGVNSNVRLSGLPLCFEKAVGAYLTDLDGNVFIDYALGMGPTILGHADARVIAAVGKTLGLGQMYAGQHPAELELALLVQRMVPSAELLRFGMTGSEMVQAALRVARAFTGRPKVVKFEGHYHGWFDGTLAGQGSARYEAKPLSLGQPSSSVAELLVLPWNDSDALQECLDSHRGQIAAVIMEPVMCNTGAILPRQGYLKSAKALCETHGTILIFDEVITGFRLGPAGAQGKFGVRPHLSVFAKAVGAGFPLAMIAGERRIMEWFADGRVNHSGTYNANVVSIAAGVAALEALAENDGAIFGKINVVGERLMRGIEAIGKRHKIPLRVSGLGAVFNTAFTDAGDVYDANSYRRANDETLHLFLASLLKRGIRPTSRGTWFVSAAHAEIDIDATLAAVDFALADLASM